MCRMTISKDELKKLAESILHDMRRGVVISIAIIFPKDDSRRLELCDAISYVRSAYKVHEGFIRMELCKKYYDFFIEEWFHEMITHSALFPSLSETEEKLMIARIAEIGKLKTTGEMFKYSGIPITRGTQTKFFFGNK